MLTVLMVWVLISLMASLVWVAIGVFFGTVNDDRRLVFVRAADRRADREEILDAPERVCDYGIRRANSVWRLSPSDGSPIREMAPRNALNSSMEAFAPPGWHDDLPPAKMLRPTTVRGHLRARPALCAVSDHTARE